MKLSILVPTVMTLFIGATAQTNWWLSLTNCAQLCALSAAAGAACDLSDLKCICKSDKFSKSFSDCATNNCALSGGDAGVDRFKKACANDTTTTTTPSTVFPSSTPLPITTIVTPTLFPTTAANATIGL